MEGLIGNVEGTPRCGGPESFLKCDGAPIQEPAGAPTQELAGVPTQELAGVSTQEPAGAPTQEPAGAQGALGLGCRSRAHHGVPRTGSSAPLLCRCCSRALHRVSRTGRSKIEGRPNSQSTLDPQRVQEFSKLSLPGSSTSAADEALLRGFKAREQPCQ